MFKCFLVKPTVTATFFMHLTHTHTHTRFMKVHYVMGYTCNIYSIEPILCVLLFNDVHNPPLFQTYECHDPKFENFCTLLLSLIRHKFNSGFTNSAAQTSVLDHQIRTTWGAG